MSGAYPDSARRPELQLLAVQLTPAEVVKCELKAQFEAL